MLGQLILIKLKILRVQNLKGRKSKRETICGKIGPTTDKGSSSEAASEEGGGVNATSKGALNNKEAASELDQATVRHDSTEGCRKDNSTSQATVSCLTDVAEEFCGHRGRNIIRLCGRRLLIEKSSGHKRDEEQEFDVERYIQSLARIPHLIIEEGEAHTTGSTETKKLTDEQVRRVQSNRETALQRKRQRFQERIGLRKVGRREATGNTGAPEGEPNAKVARGSGHAADGVRTLEIRMGRRCVQNHIANSFPPQVDMPIPIPEFHMS